MLLTVEDESATNKGLGMSVGWCMSVFYADGGIIEFMDPYWIQGAANVLIRLFRRVRLTANTVKSTTMTCHPGVIPMGI